MFIAVKINLQSQHKIMGNKCNKKTIFKLVDKFSSVLLEPVILDEGATGFNILFCVIATGSKKGMRHNTY